MKQHLRSGRSTQGVESLLDSRKIVAAIIETYKTVARAARADPRGAPPP